MRENKCSSSKVLVYFDKLNKWSDIFILRPFKIFLNYVPSSMFLVQLFKRGIHYLDYSEFELLIFSNVIVA